jgi:hypothetical protein
MTYTGAKTECWVCWRQVEIRKDGSLRRHKVTRKRGRAILVMRDGSILTVTPGGVCPASGTSPRLSAGRR